MAKVNQVLVKEIMTTPVVTIGQDADVHELERLFREKSIHGAPVVDDQGRLVGVVSQTDLINWHYEIGVDGSSFYENADLRIIGEHGATLRLADIRTARIRELMSPLTYAIEPTDTAAYAANRMMELGVHRLVVVGPDNTVVGIVSAFDLLRLIPGVSRAS